MVLYNYFRALPFGLGDLLYKVRNREGVGVKTLLTSVNLQVNFCPDRRESAIDCLHPSAFFYLKQNFPHLPQFAWQEGYGVFSLGGKQL
jgi:hypothetical protein